MYLKICIYRVIKSSKFTKSLKIKYIYLNFVDYARTAKEYILHEFIYLFFFDSNITVEQFSHVVRVRI